MTQEQKAKAYDEAIKRLEDIETGKCQKTFMFTEGLFDYIFPELKESEGERIRKELIEFVKSRGGFKQEYIAWLEAQGEQKPVIIIPKFRVGDEIKTVNEESLTITKIDEKGYWSENLFICDFDDADKWHLVEQKPAWSKKDEKMRTRCAAFLGHNYQGGMMTRKEYKEAHNWLESLKGRVQPKSQWKPSEEQMKALRSVIHSYGTHCGSDPLYHVVLTLEKDLRAL